MAWVERFTGEQPAAGQPAVQAIMSQWTWRDAAGAAAWLNENGTSAHYDAAVSAFLAAQRGRLDRETAQAWAKSIRDEKLREAQLSQVR
jgi:hypothetical protein